jgi:hypothetical protein
MKSICNLWQCGLARQVVLIGALLVGLRTTSTYADLFVGAGSTAKIDAPNLFKFVIGGQGVNTLPDSKRVSFGAGAFGTATFVDGSFDYLATFVGGGVARYGALSGVVAANGSTTPESIISPTFGERTNDGQAIAVGNMQLFFRDTGLVTSSTLPAGAPVTLNFRVSLNAPTVFSGRPYGTGDSSTSARYTGSIDDISPGATASHYTGINEGGVLNFDFNTLVGNTLQMYGNLDVAIRVQAGRDHPGADWPFYGTVQATIDASHTATVVLAAPAGVTFASTSGHDYTSAALPAPPSIQFAAGSGTTIPEGSGNFTSLPAAPGFSSTGQLAFYGTGGSGQQGIYRIVNQGTPVKVADLNTPIPGGSGNFTSFVPGNPVAPSIDGSNVAFFGAGSGGQQGIYVSTPQEPIIPGNPVRVADLNTAIPGGTGNFTSFVPGNPVAPNPAISGNMVAFFGAGSGGQQGVYAGIPGNPVKIADMATLIPGGTGAFTALPQEPSISGNNVVFLGNGSAGQQGIYRAAIGSAPLKVADLATAIPGGSGNFTSFIPGNPVAPAIDGTKVAFFGAGSGGQQGIYVSLPQDPSIPGNPVEVADKSTAIPSGTGNFTGFGDVSISATDVAFLGNGANGQQGIYDLTGGLLLKVVDLTDLVDGRAITGLHFSRVGLSGDPLAFQVTFADATQGLYTWSLPTLAGDFNADGKVDGADYVTWRKGLGRTYTQADYDVWRTHFGQTSGSGADAPAITAVPEPSSLVICGMGLAVAASVRRRKVCRATFSVVNNLRKLATSTARKQS